MLIEQCNQDRLRPRYPKQDRDIVLRYDSVQVDLNVCLADEDCEYEKIEIVSVQRCHLDQIEKWEEEDPDDVDEMPVESKMLKGLAVTFRILALDSVD